MNKNVILVPGIIFFFLSRSYSISGIINVSGRKHALRKTAYRPNQTWKSSAVYLRRKLTFAAIFLVLLTSQFDAIFNPKNASDTNATNNTPPTSKTYEFSRHRSCLKIELRRQSKPLPFRPMPAPNDRKARATQRSVAG